jgi:hypothetical protein
MSLKNLFKVLKDEGFIVPRIDKFLLTYHGGTESEDRKHGWNSPSSIGKCIRAQYYQRTIGSPDERNAPRTQRIFDNGNFVHDRLQGYLTKEGTLLIDECPVYNKDLQVLGHSDGIVRINELQLGILEIKSMNSDSFKNLHAAMPDHIEQANVYMFCLEELRQMLQGAKNAIAFNKLKKKVLKEYEDFISTFVKEGHKYSREEKIKYQVDTMAKTLDILWKCQRKIDKMYILYENKNDQDLKEYCVVWDDNLINDIKDKIKTINKHVAEEKVPARPIKATGKTCAHCRRCNYSTTCYH